MKNEWKSEERKIEVEINNRKVSISPLKFGLIDKRDRHKESEKVQSRYNKSFLSKN
jgi:hypothetical protein